MSCFVGRGFRPYSALPASFLVHLRECLSESGADPVSQDFVPAPHITKKRDWRDCAAGVAASPRRQRRSEHVLEGETGLTRGSRRRRPVQPRELRRGRMVGLVGAQRGSRCRGPEQSRCSAALIRRSIFSRVHAEFICASTLGCAYSSWGERWSRQLSGMHPGRDRGSKTARTLRSPKRA